MTGATGIPPIILHALQDGIALIRWVLARRGSGFMRSHTIERTVGDHRRLMQQAYTSGLPLNVESGKVVMTIEATLRHIYFEETTHLYNIQRLERPQGPRHEHRSATRRVVGGRQLGSDRVEGPSEP